MDRGSRTPYLLIGLAGLAGLASALALGFYLGSVATGRFYDSLTRQIAVGEAERFRVAISRLDAGQHGLLREELNMALDNALLSVCLQRTGGAEDRQTVEVLRRVAAQRREHPATYPAAWAEDRGPALEETRRRLEGCLTGAAPAPAR
jgi:hypothetical protein